MVWEWGDCSVFTEDVQNYVPSRISAVIFFNILITIITDGQVLTHNLLLV